MNEQQKKAVIENYIQAYNNFDVDGMTKDLHVNVVFQNITNGEVDLTTNGIFEFSTQAEKAKTYFSTRKQVIEKWSFQGNKVMLDISYEGILAVNIPGGAMIGDTLELTGQSEFIFEENRIINIRDMS